MDWFTTDAVYVPTYLDLLAVFLGGLSGSLFAVRRGFAVTGVLALAIAAGLGGGILRDVLLHAGPPLALTNASYLPTVLVAAAIGFFFGSLVGRFNKPIVLMDAVWLGLYAVVGAEKALNLGFSPFSAVLVGALAATGGSVLMEVLAGEQPGLVKPGPIGHFGALIGAVLFVLMASLLDLPAVIAEIVTVLAVFLIRVAALRWDIQAPTPVDIPQKVSTVVGKSRRKSDPGKGGSKPADGKPDH